MQIYVVRIEEIRASPRLIFQTKNQTMSKIALKMKIVLTEVALNKDLLLIDPKHFVQAIQNNRQLFIVKDTIQQKLTI